MNEEVIHCENCGDEIEHSDPWYDDDGRMLCYDCYLDTQDKEVCNWCNEEFASDELEYTDAGHLCPNCAEQFYREEKLYEEALTSLDTAIDNFEEIGYHPADEILVILRRRYPSYDFVNMAFNLKNWR